MSTKNDDEPWMALPMPSADEIAAMVAWIESHPDSETMPAYHLEAEGLEEWGAFYCERHAKEEALRRNHERDIDDSDSLFCSDDRLVRRFRYDDGESGPLACERCGVSLDGGGLNDDGIKSELGLSETDPMAVGIGLPELLMLEHALLVDDPRMRLWMHHAKRAQRWALKRALEIEQTAARLVAESQTNTHPRRRKCVREEMNRGYQIARDAGPFPVSTVERAGWLAHEMLMTEEG